MFESLRIQDVVIGGREVQGVEGRELFVFLFGENTKTKFADWIRRNIKKYSFVEDSDFGFRKKTKALNSGANATFKDYLLTINTAKELSMIANNDQGREARKYFIGLEAKYKEELEKNLKLEKANSKLIKRIKGCAKGGHRSARSKLIKKLGVMENKLDLVLDEVLVLKKNDHIYKSQINILKNSLIENENQKRVMENKVVDYIYKVDGLNKQLREWRLSERTTQAVLFA